MEKSTHTPWNPRETAAHHNFPPPPPAPTPQDAPPAYNDLYPSTPEPKKKKSSPIPGDHKLQYPAEAPGWNSDSSVPSFSSGPELTTSDSESADDEGEVAAQIRADRLLAQALEFTSRPAAPAPGPGSSSSLPPLHHSLAIPQLSTPGHDASFVRAYSAQLATRGVRAEDFVAFIDNLNALGATERSGGMRFLEEVNERFFAPRGLRVGVVTEEGLREKLGGETRGMGDDGVFRARIAEDVTFDVPAPNATSRALRGVAAERRERRRVRFEERRERRKERGEERGKRRGERDWDRAQKERERAEEQKERAREMAKREKERATEIAEREKERAKEIAEREKERAEEQKERAKEIAKREKERAEEQKERAREIAKRENERAEEQKERAREISKMEKERAEEQKEWSKEIAKMERERAEEQRERSMKQHLEPNRDLRKLERKMAKADLKRERKMEKIVRKGKRTDEKLERLERKHARKTARIDRDLLREGKDYSREHARLEEQLRKENEAKVGKKPLWIYVENL